MYACLIQWATVKPASRWDVVRCPEAPCIFRVRKGRWFCRRNLKDETRHPFFRMAESRSETGYVELFVAVEWCVEDTFTLGQL